jgi:aspartokinase/homoserine dehydrogenase 1
MDFTNPVKGISHIDKISLITLEVRECCWFFQKTFEVLSQENVNVFITLKPPQNILSVSEF